MSFYLWDELAANNTNADPSIDWRENQAPSTVNNSARAMMAALAKYRDDMAGIITTGGSDTLYTASSNQGYVDNGDGNTITVIMHATNGAAPALNVDAAGSLPILLATGVAPPAGTLAEGSVHRFTSDGTNWFVNGYIASSTTAIANIDLIGGTQLTAPAIDDTLLIYDLSATANRRILVSDFYKTLGVITAETAIALDDLLPLYDTSASLPKAMTPVNILKVLNLLTEDTAPDSVADFLLSYDTSATTVKKIKPQGLVAAGAMIAIIQDNKSQNTNGQDFANGTNTRQLNTLVYNRATTVSLNSNQFTLPAGEWDVEWVAPLFMAANESIRHQTYLYNVTDSTFDGFSLSGAVDMVDTDSQSVYSGGFAHVSLAGSKAYEIRHIIDGSAGVIKSGFASNFTTEVYTQVVIRKG